MRERAKNTYFKSDSLCSLHFSVHTKLHSFFTGSKILLLFAAISGFVIAKTSNPEKRLLEAEQLPVSVGHKTKLQHRIWIWK